MGKNTKIMYAGDEYDANTLDRDLIVNSLITMCNSSRKIAITYGFVTMFIALVISSFAYRSIAKFIVRGYSKNPHYDIFVACVFIFAPMLIWFLLKLKIQKMAKEKSIISLALGHDSEIEFYNRKFASFVLSYFAVALFLLFFFCAPVAVGIYAIFAHTLLRFLSSLIYILGALAINFFLQCSIEHSATIHICSLYLSE